MYRSLDGEEICLVKRLSLFNAKLAGKVIKKEVDVWSVVYNGAAEETRPMICQ